MAHEGKSKGLYSKWNSNQIVSSNVCPSAQLLYTVICTCTHMTVYTFSQRHTLKHFYQLCFFSILVSLRQFVPHCLWKCPLSLQTCGIFSIRKRILALLELLSHSSYNHCIQGDGMYTDHLGSHMHPCAMKGRIIRLIASS